MRTVTTAEYARETRAKTFATLEMLYSEGLIQGDLADGEKAGYTFTLTLSPDAKSFALTATPKGDPALLDHFYVDETGVIRVNTGAAADANSPPIQ